MIEPTATPDRLLTLLQECAAKPGDSGGEFAATVIRYVATGDVVDAVLPSWPWPLWQIRELPRLAAQLYQKDALAMRLAEMALLNTGRAHGFVVRFFAEVVSDEVKRRSDAFLKLSGRWGIPGEKMAAQIALATRGTLSFGWEGSWKCRDALGKPEAINLDGRTAPQRLAAANDYERFVMETDAAGMSQALVEMVTEWGELGEPNESALSTLAAFRPEAVAGLMERARTVPGLLPYGVWGHVLKITDRWDAVYLEAAAQLELGERLELLDVLRRTGRLKHFSAGVSMALGAARDPQQPYAVHALLMLADFAPEEFQEAFERAIDGYKIQYGQAEEEALAIAAGQWDRLGKGIFGHLLTTQQRTGQKFSYVRAFWQIKIALGVLLKTNGQVPASEIQHWFHEALHTAETQAPTTRQRHSELDYFWKTAVRNASDVLAGEFLEKLGSSAQSMREHAVNALVKCSPEIVLPKVLKMLASRRADEREGAAEMLTRLADPATAPEITQALATETVLRIRQALHAALNASGKVEAIAEVQEASYLPPAGGKRKMPSAAWLAGNELPALYDKDGVALDAETVAALLATQSASKVIAPSSDLAPLLARIDRSRSGDFARVLLERYLAGGSPVEDRWAMALAGMLGDAGIIPPLQSRILVWCKERRGKLAEYAAQAISLLPGNEPLAALDALSKRYRQKFRNVGIACEKACASAAKMRGLSEEELRDVIVPTAGFDEQGVRTFTWSGHGGVNALLGESGGLTWADPTSEKTWKSFPASASAEVQKEVKAMVKTLKDTLKAQTSRLESALGRQRRWSVARWQEIFGAHPVLRSLSGPLVWGVYEESGRLLRTFRRYPNGLLADAAGALEELQDDAPVQIGLVHPLELDDASRQAWSAHLVRLKSKPPFPQIDRPWVLADPLHGNRCLLSLTRDVSMIPATLRSRLEKRGWERPARPGEKVIPGYTRHFPEHGLEAVLPTPNLWTFEALNPVILPAAFFLRDAPVLPDSIKYTERSSNDPALVKFADIPSVAWSEVVSDLKAILGETASPSS